jgi:hypothetical protein
LICCPYFESLPFENLHNFLIGGLPMSRLSKYHCPDCKQVFQDVIKDTEKCSDCGKRICTYCHVDQKGSCQRCKAKPVAAKPMSIPAAKPKAAVRKRKFLFF